MIRALRRSLPSKQEAGQETENPAQPGGLAPLLDMRRPASCGEDQRGRMVQAGGNASRTEETAQRTGDQSGWSVSGQGSERGRRQADGDALRKTGGNSPRENTRFCPFAVFSARRSEQGKRAESLAPSAFAGGLPSVCNWGRVGCAIKNGGRKCTPRPLFMHPVDGEKITAGIGCRDIRRRTWEGGSFHFLRAGVLSNRFVVHPNH